MAEPSFNRPYGPVTLAELTAGLVWPRLFRSFVLSVRPSRVALGTLTVLAMWGLALLIGWLSEPASPSGKRPQGIGERVMLDIADGVAGMAAGAVSLDTRGVKDSFELARTALTIHADRWGLLAVTLLVLLPVWLVGGAAISRGAALEVAGDVEAGMGRCLVFGVRRMGTLMRAVLLPVVIAAAVSLILKAAGWALFSLPGLSMVGALLYPLALLAGLFATLVWLGFIFGKALLVPAIAVENAGAMDAVQRAYSYVLGRPGRTVAYMAVLAAIGCVGLVFIAWLVKSSHTVADVALSAWLSPEREAVVMKPGDGQSLTSGTLWMWGRLLVFVVAGWATSFYFTGSTLLYLLLRRVLDEQDISEVWMPGMVGGTMAKKA